MSERLTEEQLQALLKKVEREFPVRMRLAKLAGVPTKPLIDFTHTLLELFLLVQIHAPDKVEEARQAILAAKV